MNTPDLAGVAWHKSSRSGSNANCVEVARLPRSIAVRDSQDPHGPVLTVSPVAWSAFVTEVRTGYRR